MISAILLAAGESRRMAGAFKPLLKWGKRTVIEACINNLRESRVDEIIVVLGHREAEIRARLAGAGVEFAINHDYQKGMISSIQTGLTLISPQSDAALIALADQPMVGPQVINRLIDGFEQAGKGIVLPTSGGRHGHPIILSAGYTDEVMSLDDAASDGLRTVIDAHRDDVYEVPVDTAVVLEDIDRPEDYERLSKQVEPIYEYHKWHP